MVRAAANKPGRTKPAKAASKAKRKQAPATAKAKNKVKAKPKAKAKAKATSKAKPKRNGKTAKRTSGGRAKVRAKATRKERTGAKPAPHVESSVPIAIEHPEPTSSAVPQPIPVESSNESARRTLTARERTLRSSPVFEILDDPYPVGALRRFLDSVKGLATPQQAQIALGAAQLMLVPEKENRGSAEVKEIVDLLLSHWDQFGDRRRGFHAQEFLRNALATVGIDRDRIQKLEDLIPTNPTAEVLFNLACAHAVARDKVAMLRAVERALEAGATPTQFRRDEDFLVYANDPDFTTLLSRAEVPPIPVDVAPHVPLVRVALERLVGTLKELGEPIELRPPVRLDAILDAERVAKISLPNDYRALLTITNGMVVLDRAFFGAGDYRERTNLALSAMRYLQASANHGTPGIEDCVPLASWGQANDWLLYDPRGRIRGDRPGYVLMHNVEARPCKDLLAALARIEELARNMLGAN